MRKLSRSGGDAKEVRRSRIYLSRLDMLCVLAGAGHALLEVLGLLLLLLQGLLVDGHGRDGRWWVVGSEVAGVVVVEI